MTVHALRALDGALEPDQEESFRFLTDADWQLLMEKSRQVDFATDQVVIEEGENTRRILFIARGSVRIERIRAGRAHVLARIGAGQVLGEISFIDNLGAAASVVADEPTTIELISGDHVDALLASVSGFAVRFYLSLASTLARRLRATSEQIAAT